MVVFAAFVELKSLESFQEAKHLVTYGEHIQRHSFVIQQLRAISFVTLLFRQRSLSMQA